MTHIIWNRILALGTALPLATLLTACGGVHESLPSATHVSADLDLDLGTLCETGSYHVSTNCKPGQKIAFLPGSFGNEQLPVMFAALNCDLRYAVALTTGAVTCVFNPIKPESKPPESPAASAASGG